MNWKQVEANNKRIIESLANDKTELISNAYGEHVGAGYTVSVLLTTKIDEASQEGDADNWLSYVESWLCDENEKVRAFFSSKGVKF